MRLISKAIVGAAVASACSYASASTVGTTGVTALSLEGVQVTAGTSDISNNTVRWTLGDSWVQNDTVDFSTSAAFGSVTTHAQSFTCSAATGNSTVFTIVSGSSNASNIRYVASNPVGTTANQVCDINTIAFRASSIASSGNVTVSASGRKAATLFTFDTSPAGTVLSVAQEYSITLSAALNAQIDVQGGRLSFTSTETATGLSGPTAYTSADYFTVSLNRVLGKTQPTAVTGTLAVTLTANSGFAYLAELNDAGSCTVSSGSGRATGTSSVMTAADTVPTFASGANSGTCSSMTATFATVAPGAFSIVLGRVGTPSAATDAPFVQQSYGASATLTGGTGGAVTLASSGSLNAGTWTINGTTVNIPYVPISSAISLQIFVANRSAQAGAVNFTAWNASGTQCSGSLGTIDANANGTYGSALRTALQGCTGSGWSDATRATVQLVTPTPSTTTTVHTSFGAADTTSRQILINDTNGK